MIGNVYEMTRSVSNAFRAAHIQQQKSCFTAVRLNRLSGLLAAGFVASRNNDIKSTPCKLLGRFKSNASIATGNKRDALSAVNAHDKLMFDWCLWRARAACRV